MVEVLNVAVGAMLGVILADSPIFQHPKLTDMPLVILFIVLTVLFAGNIGITLRAMRARLRPPSWLIPCSIAAFLVTEIGVFLTFNISELPSGQASG